MPRGDGTGPLGLGPVTGRGMGRRGGFTWCGSRMRPPGRILFSLAIVAIGAVVKDARDPAGFTRKLFRVMGRRLRSFHRKPEVDTIRAGRTVDALVLPEIRESK